MSIVIGGLLFCCQLYLAPIHGSDLKMDLPLQSLMKTNDEVFHNPIRLSTLIQAPENFIIQILVSDEKLESLLYNGWTHLFITDPEKNNILERYNHYGHL